MCGKLYSVLEDQLRMVVRNVQKCVAKSKQFKKCHRNTQIYIFCWQVILCIWVIAYSDGSLHRQRSAQNRIAVFMANERSLMKSTAALAISVSSGKIEMLPELSSPVRNLHLPTCMTLMENSGP